MYIEKLFYVKLYYFMMGLNKFPVNINMCTKRLNNFDADYIAIRHNV